MTRMNELPKERRDMSLREKLCAPEASEPPWRLLSALLTVFAMFICLAIIGPSIIAITAASPFLTPFELMASWSIGMALTVAFVVVSRRASEASWTALKLRRGELPLPFALLVGLAIGLTIDLTVNLAGGRFLPPPQIWAFQTGGAPSLILAALLLAILQPVAETLVFYAVLLPRLRWTFGHWLGVFATAALYSGLHYLIFFQAYDFYSRPWHGVALPLLIGLAFGLLKVVSQSSLVVLIGRMAAGLSFFLTALAIAGG